MRQTCDKLRFTVLTWTSRPAPRGGTPVDTDMRQLVFYLHGTSRHALRRGAPIDRHLTTSVLLTQNTELLGLAVIRPWLLVPGETDM